MSISISAPDIDRAVDGMWARRETVLNAGRGEVLTAKRNKIKGERRKAIHGGQIANTLAKNGHDPFGYPAAVMDEVQGDLSELVADALSEAGQTRRPTTDQVRDALRGVALELAEWARQNLRGGGLGQNTGKYLRRKTKLTYAGVYTTEYGTPAPRGIATGRFLAGISGGWVLGRRRRAARTRRGR